MDQGNPFSSVPNPSSPQGNIPPRPSPEGIIKKLQKDFVIVGKTRVHTWQAWLVIGLAAGISIGIAFVANRSGEVEPSIADSPKKEEVQEFVPGRVLVRFKDNVKEDEAELELTEEEPEAQEEGEIGNSKIKIVKVPEGKERKIVERLERHPKVEFAEVDQLFPEALVPNDSQYSSQWHLSKINAPAAWDITTGKNSVTIAIIDSGVESTHPEFSGRMVAGFNFVSNNTNTADVTGHGTEVAGIAAATGNNGEQIASLTWGTKIMPVRVAESTGYASAVNIGKAIRWAADNGARVANLSFNNLEGSQTVKDAANYFRSKGGVVIVAAGNCKCVDPDPENTALISVSATNQSDALASNSSKGAYVDLSAPGVSLTTTLRGGTSGCCYSGTSFASPVVAGVAALMLSVNSSLTPSQIESILETTSVPLGSAGWDNSFGWGRVNAAAAVVGSAASLPADTIPPTTAITSPTSGATVSGGVSVTASASDNSGVISKVEFRKNGTLVFADTVAPYGYYWNTSSDANGSYTWQAKAYDMATNPGTSANVTVTVNNVVSTVPGFPVKLQGTPLPEEKTVTFNTTKNPGSFENAVLTMTVFDGEYQNEGELYVNGNGPVALFGNQAVSQNNDVVKVLTYTMPASWWRTGDNTLRFVHKSTVGYRVDSVAIDFSGSVTSSASSEIIVDNDQVSQTAGGGGTTTSWCRSTAPNPYGGTSLYSCGGKVDVYRWAPQLTESGTYEVYAWWTANINRSTNVPYTMRKADGTIATTTVNQQQNGGKWNFLGTYTLGGNSYVEVSDFNGPQASADAVKFIKR